METLVEYENGGKIDVYTLVDQSKDDFKKIFACCEYFAQQGKHVIITPRFHATTVNAEYEAIYSSLKGTPYWGKCPDFCVDGVWYEHEGYEEEKDLTAPHKKASTFSNMLGRGVKQSERIIVEDCGVGHRYAIRNIFNRINKEHQKIEEVYIRTAEGLVLLYKKEQD